MVNSQSYRSKEWVVSCRRKDLLNKNTKYLYNNCRLCANHFEDGMFLNFKKNRLKPDAKPTLFDVPNPPAKIGTKRRKLQRNDPLPTPHGKYIFYIVTFLHYCFRNVEIDCSVVNSRSFRKENQIRKVS